MVFECFIFIFFVILGSCIFIFSLLISDQESFVDFDDSEMVVPLSQGLVKASQGTVFSDSSSRSVLRKPFTGKIVFGSYFFIFCKYFLMVLLFSVTHLLLVVFMFYHTYAICFLL